MRTLVVAAAVVVVAFAGGCTGVSEPEERGASPSAGTAEPDVPVVDSLACEEVRAGIDAFNDRDYDATVEHFELAVPLAEAQDDGTTMASELIEAVRYYAALEAELYPEAARSSPEFARYKAITLGQCRPVGSESESPGSNV